VTNTKCKFYRTSECPEEKQPLIICDLCNKLSDIKKIKCHICGNIFTVESDIIHNDCPQCLNPINCIIHELSR